MTTRPAPTATDELETVRQQMEQGRKRAQQAIGTLEERYQGIVSAWLPDGIEGSIKLDGKGLRVDAQFSGRGEVSTAALDSLKIVAFDLAAMHLAIEEKADLPAVLYARLFELIHRWETESTAPCFQYIITTTTAPPTPLQSDEYVVLQMSSTPPAARLFGIDL